MSGDIDPFEVRMTAAQQGMAMMDAFDEGMLELLGPLHEATSNMADHLTERGLKRHQVAGILIGFALSAAYPEPRS